MKYHVTSSKKVRECKCNPCRAKYGQWDSEIEAEIALDAVKTGGSLDAALEREIAGDSTPETADTPIAADELVAALAPLEEASEPKAAPAASPSEGNLLSRSEVKDTYLDDDLEFLAGDDQALSLTPTASIFEQNENLVAWRLENFYDEDEKRKSKYALRASPPILVIESSDGSSAEFLLTRQLSATLAETFEMVSRGYHGVDPKRKDSLTQGPKPKKIDVMKTAMQEHPLKTGLFIVLFLLVVITVATL